MSRTSQRTIRLIAGGAFFAFFLFGFVDNLKGPTLSALLKNLQFSYTKGGTILFGAYAGFFLATLLSGFLADRVGKKAVIIGAGLSLFCGVLAYSTGSTLWLLVLAMSLIGFGLGAIELGGNAVIVEAFPAEKGRYLNLLGVFHGLGSVLAPLFAGGLLASGLTWRRVYQFSLVLVILMPLYFLILKYPRVKIPAAGRDERTGLGKTVFTGQMPWFYALIALYVASEISIGSWLAEFLQKAKFQTELTSSRYISLFFVAILLGRLAGSYLVDRWGYLRAMFLASAAATACVTVGILAPPALAFFIPLAGLFYSIIFPTATAAVSERSPANQGSILGLFFAFAGVGGMLGPWLIGVCSDWIGIHWGAGVITLYGLAMILVMLTLMKRSGVRFLSLLR